MRRSLLILSLLLTVAAHAQTRIGVFLGTQPYESSSDDPRYLPGIELLAQRGRLGGHLAVDYADLAAGKLIATHVDAAWVHPLGERASFLVGAGPTYVIVGGGTKLTWNAEAELARRWGSVEGFVRIRKYDFSFPVFRDRPASPKGPAGYVGVRFTLIP
ncbi:MAG TPA: hypothetical protein VJ276_02960 [Thermoanaerobaculia bacterium]|nr:hypothetical protein [Thermoanaerobaculia bacterium]